ncbi:S8 family peptidase [Methylorubrum extorquens]|uniref:S8 family peptidase n=1 Tax=Methylorubrum extorquens TaxID=408 RepID=UPI001EE57A6B|nr:S8 family serine peptidase [Methylorubrum extorquens]MCG5248423.1 S8 family serine peptidase [Methylorubrum extorquens]
MNADERIKVSGHALVFVVLKPTMARRRGGRVMLAFDETRDAQVETARKLRGHFRTFPNSRLSVLAREAPPPAADGEAVEVVADERVRAVVGRSSGLRYYPNLGILYGTVDEKGLTALSQDDAVEEVFAPPTLGLIRPEEDAALDGPERGISWGVRRLRVDRLWERGLTGDGVLIGHADTGVDSAHPALQGKVDAFAYFDVTGQQIAKAVSGDTQYHGSHTAGILVGAAFDDLSFGVAPGARLASATVIEGGDVPGRVTGALNWAVGQGVRIVNLSLGLPGFQPQLSTFMRILRQRNILPVVAIGNDGPQSSRVPGNVAESLSVGAIDQTDQIWYRSSSEQIDEVPKRITPTLIGPGAGVWSCVPGAAMRSLSGTSMAAPHVAGLAALLMQHRPEASIDAIQNAITGSCKRPAGISTLRGNKGVPDAVDALALLEATS